MDFGTQEIDKLLGLLDQKLREITLWQVPAYNTTRKFNAYIKRLEGVEVLLDEKELAVAFNQGSMEGKILVPPGIRYHGAIGHFFTRENFLVIDKELATKILVLGTWPE